MGNDIEGVEWAREYRGRGFPDSSYQFNLAYRYLEDYLDENKNRKVRLHQVCASSEERRIIFRIFQERFYLKHLIFQMLFQKI